MCIFLFFFAHRHGCAFVSNKYESVYKHAKLHDSANKGWLKETILTTSSAVWSTVFADNTHLLLQQPPVIRKDLPASILSEDGCTGQKCSFCFNIDGTGHGNRRHHARQVQAKCPLHVEYEASYAIINHAVKVKSIYRYDAFQKRLFNVKVTCVCYFLLCFLLLPVYISFCCIVRAIVAHNIRVHNNLCLLLLFLFFFHFVFLPYVIAESSRTHTTAIWKRLALLSIEPRQGNVW